MGCSFVTSIELTIDRITSLSNELIFLNSTLGVITSVIELFEALTLSEVLTLYVTRSLVFDGAIPSLSVPKIFAGSKLTSET